MKSMIYKFPIPIVPGREVFHLPGPGARVLSCGAHMQQTNHGEKRIDAVVWVEFDSTEGADGALGDLDSHRIEVMTAWTGTEFEQEIRAWLFVGSLKLDSGSLVGELVLHVYWRPIP